MAVDRRASASKTYAERKKKEEQEKARKAVLAAAKRDVENAKSQVGAKERPAYRTGMKNANAGKAPDKTVKSPVKESTKKSSYRTGMKNANAGKTSDRTVKSPISLPTSYRQSFLTPAALPTQQNNGTQSIKKTMQGRSEDYARLENRKAGADEATRKKIEAAQKKLHEQNVQDARKIGAAFHASGAWMQKGKPLYQANVLPGQSKAEQIDGTKKSLAAQILSPSQQETIAEYEEKNRQPDALERVKKTITGAGKLYAGSTENALGLGVTGRNEGRKQEDEREIEVWKDEIQTWKQSLKDWEADGSLTEDEREELNRLIEVNQKKIDTYYQAHGAQKKAAEELYRSADKLAQSGAEDIGRAKEGLENAGQTLVDVGVGGAQLAGDIALGGVAPMFLRSVGGSAQQARQEGATHSKQVNYGMLSGAVGILSEKISNVAGPLNKAFGKGAADDLLQGAINKAVSKLAGSEAGEKILGAIAKQGANALGEGFEEGLEAAIDPVLKRMTYDPNAQLELADVIHDSIVGAGVGIAAGTGGEVVQNTINGALGLPGKIAEKTQGTKPVSLPTVTTRETETVQPKPLPVQEMQDSQTFGQDAAAQMQGLPVQTAQETETVQPKSLPVETAQDTETVKPRPVQGMQDTYGQAGSYDDFMRPLTGLRDKLASDLQNARQTLPGPGTESRIRELESGLEDVNRQLAAMEKNRAQFSEAQEIAEKLGAKFTIADLGEASGKFENGTITINPYSRNPVRQVLVHELTHYIESSGQYNTLREHVMSFIAQDLRTDVGALINAVTEDYAANGVQLDADGARREIVAKFCEEKLFTDEKSIQRLAETDRGLFRRIRQWISDTIAKLRGTKQQNALRKMERLYEKAARTVGEVNGYGAAQYAFGESGYYDGKNKVLYVALDEYGEPVFPENRSWRKADETSPMSEWGHAMFADEAYGNWNRVDQLAANGSDSVYSVEIEKLTPIDDVRQMIIDAWNADKENDFADYYEIMPEALTELDAEEIADQFDPADIIDSAGAYDDSDLLMWGYQRVFEPNNIGGVKTNDGAVVFDEDLIDRVRLSEPARSVVGYSMGLGFDELRNRLNARQQPEQQPEQRPEQQPERQPEPQPEPQPEQRPEQLSERRRNARMLTDAWNARRQAQAHADEVRETLTLTQRDIELAQQGARSGVDSIRWENANNPENAYFYSEALANVREADRPIREFLARRHAEMQGNAQEAADWIAEFARDKRSGLLYQRETMERNIRDIFGARNRDLAENIIRDYITPVHEAVADGTRLKNRMRERVRSLGLDTHERALVQMRMENENAAMLEYMENNGIRMNPELESRINHAADEMRSIYNELYEEMNASLVLNGYEPAPFRQNYAPHFTKDRPDTMLARLRFALGLGRDSSLNVPTDIAGITDQFRPGRKWFGNLLQREGEITDYDAVAGFDRYIETAADVITLTDCIQNLRELEDAVRYTMSDEGVRDRIDEIRADPDLDALQRRQEIENVYGSNPDTAQQMIDDLRGRYRMGMGGFVTELRRYTDNLAGKKSREDRGWEDMVGRQVYAVAKNAEGRVAANMIAANPGSWLTNLIPITQAIGEVDAVDMLRGMADTVAAYVRDDEFADSSTFLTNRRGSDSIDKTAGRALGDALGAPMGWIDQFTAETIVRARTRQNIRRGGMQLFEAIDEADAFAAGLMADRSKGSMPTLFNARNPVMKAFTMFQLEVNNQFSYIAKDMLPRLGENGVAALALGVSKFLAGAFLYNCVYRELTGRDAAFDPIGMIVRAFGIGEDEEDKPTAAETVKSLATDVAENLPFVGGLLGGGRVPIQSAIPNFGNLWAAATDSEKAPEKRIQMATKELAKPATYLLPPFGGGAVRRAVEGYQAVKQGGVYGMDNEGNKTLNFPIYGQGVKDYAQAMLFGRYSFPTGRAYVDSGFEGKLNADQTAAYEQLASSGADRQTAYEGVKAVASTQAPEDGSKTRKQAQREALMGLDLTAEQKTELASRMFGGNDMVSWQDADSFDITNNVAPRNQAKAFQLMREQGMNTEQAKKYAELVDEQGATYTKGEDGHYIKDSKSVRLKKAYETVQADENLSEEQKNGVVRAVVLPELGKKYTGQYAAQFTGDIDAVQIIDAQAAFDEISETVKKDLTINEKNRSEYVRLRFADYLKSTGLSRSQQDRLWYFQSHSESDFKEPWSEIIRLGGEDVKKACPKLRDSGMDEATYKAIKAGMDRIYADKDANGETIKDSKKRKLIAFLNEYDDLTTEQKNLLMQADGYKYGMGEKPKSGSSKKKNPFVLPTPTKMPSLKSLLPF